MMVRNDSNKGKEEERSLCGILRNSTAKQTTETKIFIRYNF